MTTSTMTPVAPFGAITTHRIVSAALRVVAALRDAVETRRTITVLRGLSADQLEDIGLTRADVAEMGHKGL